MMRARIRRRRALGRSGVLAVLLVLVAARARAEQAERGCEEGGTRACGCAHDASCWDFSFLSSGRTTLLGLTATLSAIELSRADRVEAGLLVSFRTDVYRASGPLNSHVSASGAIGAGSAGNEGALAAAIDFGVRFPVSSVRGPVLRIGPSGSLLGHEALQLALLEPLRLVAGFQHMVGDTVLEGGLTIGMLGAGRFAVGERRAGLAGSFALGHYLAAQLDAFRFDGRVISLRPSPFAADVHVGIVQIEACAQPRPIGVCADVRYVQSQMPPPRALRGAARTGGVDARGLYVGATVGFMP